VLKCAGLRQKETRRIQFKHGTTSFITSHCKIARLVVSNRCYYFECPLTESNQRALITDRTYLSPVMGSPILTNYCRPEIHGKILRTHSMGRCDYKRPILCARRFHRQQLHDESESDNSSGLVHYNIETSDESPVEGNNDAEDSGDDDSEVEEFGNKDNAAEKSDDQVDDYDPSTIPEVRSKRWFVQGPRDVYYVGLALNEKGNPSRSIQEEPRIQINALNEVPNLKRLFEGYNMY
ncbi:hypothetical protein HAX54_052653, partial [Datura stramonium]|nr:hypothetical protein [Datura stramonium]